MGFLGQKRVRECQREVLRYVEENGVFVGSKSCRGECSFCGRLRPPARAKHVFEA